MSRKRSAGGSPSLVRSNMDMEVPVPMKVDPVKEEYDYDLIIVGGGSGGVACAKAAKDVAPEAKVCILDYVSPSPHGSQWGFGGTCVNVGCIPKKLFHWSAMLGEYANDAAKHGWTSATNGTHNWDDFSIAVSDVTGNLSWNYTVTLRDLGIEYVNALGSFVDPHTIETVNRQKKRKTITGRDIVIATGGRPRYPDCPGGTEFTISSDDVFTLEKDPGKTVVLGGAYIALECASFLKGLGKDVTVLARSILLRGFDQEMANRVGDYLTAYGVDIVRGVVPTRIEQKENGKILLSYAGTAKGSEEVQIECDTVLSAIGRIPNTHSIGLDKIGVKLAKNGKIICDNEQTNVPNVYAIGDVLDGQPELTPVAAEAGVRLAHRILGSSTKRMDYRFIPTTVFTAIEYSACGLSEEDAIERFGPENIVIYHTEFQPHENDISVHSYGPHYVKLICNKEDDLRVVGLHILAHNCGEMMQGYAVALKMGATYYDFKNTIGIHPTASESIVQLKVTKDSGVDVSASAGCST